MPSIILAKLGRTKIRHQWRFIFRWVSFWIIYFSSNCIRDWKFWILYLDVAGEASFDVVTTDYKTYAGIYTCQNLLFFKRQSATILSRTTKLDEGILKKVNKKNFIFVLYIYVTVIMFQMRYMFDEHLTDLQLKTIRHDNCNGASSQILLTVKSNLASSINFSRTVPTLPSMIVTNSKEV